ncbi:MAG: tRNA 2-thiouridine synthesizing protein C [Oleiphilaceae bacterium]|jgi:tRNA 2-thiouridine synthesizing protein C
MTQIKKKLLIVQSKAPFGSSSIQESLDIVLAAGTFDQDISLLIEGDACFQLLKNQQPELINRKNTTKMLQALPIYGVDKVLVCSESASLRKLTPTSHNNIFRFVSKDEINTIYSESDTVIRF